MNELITKQDDMAEHKPKPDTNAYVYVSGLSVFGLAIGGYLMHSKFKKQEQNLIDIHLLLCQRLALNQKETFFKCFKNFYDIIYKWLKIIRKI